MLRLKPKLNEAGNFGDWWWISTSALKQIGPKWPSCPLFSFSSFPLFLDRSLMIGWRKNSWNPERVSSVFTFVSVCLCVCPSVCTRATEHTFWPNLGSHRQWRHRYCHPISISPPPMLFVKPKRMVNYVVLSSYAPQSIANWMRIPMVSDMCSFSVRGESF